MGNKKSRSRWAAIKELFKDKETRQAIVLSAITSAITNLLLKL